MPVKQARIRLENIESGTNRVGKPPFGLKLCAVRAVPLRMPPTYLDCQKTQKINSKTWVLAIFGPWAPSGPISALFPGVVRCAAGVREAQFTLVALVLHWAGALMLRQLVAHRRGDSPGC